MIKFLFGDESIIDEFVQIPLIDKFRTESEWLKNKRQELIATDKNGANLMLINNPNRAITLRHPTVLIGGY